MYNLYLLSYLALWLQQINQAQSEYKNVLANILRSLFVARTPPVEARSPDCRSNVENAPVGGGSASAPRRPPVAGRQRAQTPPSRPFALCRHITDCRSNVENAPVGPRPLPVCGARFWGRPPSPAGHRPAACETPPSRPFALCRHIAGLTQACN